MPFVKIDTKIVDSSLWVERDARSLFLTALFSASPHELTEPTPQIAVDSLDTTGWTVPPGWYGLVEASGPGLIRKDGCDLDIGLRALSVLGSPDQFSRSPEYDGRRLVRITGGFLVLNYFAYRDKDYTAATRMQRMRARRRQTAEGSADDDDGEHDELSPGDDVTRNVTHSREQRAESIGKEQDQESMSSAGAPDDPAGNDAAQSGNGETRVTIAGAGKSVTARGKRALQQRTQILAQLAGVFADISAQTTTRIGADKLRKLQAEMLFLYWTAKFDHSGALLDRKREAKLVARLKECDGNVSELLYALDGAARDDWIMGRDAKSNGRKYDDIVTILRDRSQVERFANVSKDYRAGTPHKLIPRLEAALRADNAVQDSDGGTPS